MLDKAVRHCSVSEELVPHELMVVYRQPSCCSRQKFVLLVATVIFLLTFVLFLHHWLPDVCFNQVQGTLLRCMPLELRQKIQKLHQSCQSDSQLETS